MGLRTTRSDFTARRRGMSLLAIVALATPIFLFVILRSFPGLDKAFMSANFHLVVVSAIAACAVGIALIAGIAAGRSRDAALVFVALGCLAVGMIMLAHGLVTPGVAGVGANLWVGRLPNFAIAAFALTQLLAVLPVTRRLAPLVARHPWLSLTIPTLDPRPDPWIGCPFDPHRIPCEDRRGRDNHGRGRGTRLRIDRDRRLLRCGRFLWRRQLLRSELVRDSNPTR